MALQSKRTRTRSGYLWRVSILLLFAGLVSVSALAKNSFEMPSTNAAHWISQACKMREAARVGAPHAVALQAMIAAFLYIPNSPRAIDIQQSDQPLSLTPDFFWYAALRAPPAI